MSHGLVNLKWAVMSIFSFSSPLYLSANQVAGQWSYMAWLNVCFEAHPSKQVLIDLGRGQHSFPGAPVFQLSRVALCAVQTRCQLYVQKCQLWFWSLRTERVNSLFLFFLFIFQVCGLMLAKTKTSWSKLLKFHLDDTSQTPLNVNALKISLLNYEYYHKNGNMLSCQ